MSKYTTEVRFVCEQLAGLDESVGYDKVEEIIALARPKIFDFDYPIFDSDYKEVLETKILKHYYTREIGQETVGLWKLRLNAKMNEIMPYYNKLYASELLTFNPFHDVDKRVEHEGEDDGRHTTTTLSEGEKDNTKNVSDERDTNVTKDSQRDRNYSENVSENEWNLFSDTPQGGVSGIDRFYDDTVSDNSYLTDARNIRKTTNKTGQEHETIHATEDTHTEGREITTGHEEDNRNTNVNGEFDNKNKWIELTTGKQGSLSYSKMLVEFRETFLNIDMMIIKDLKNLFFQLW